MDKTDAPKPSPKYGEPKPPAQFNEETVSFEAFTKEINQAWKAYQATLAEMEKGLKPEPKEKE